MKKKLNYYESYRMYSNCQKLLLIMKITIFLLFFGLINLVAGPSYSQNTKISLDMKDVSIESVLSKIEDVSEFYFLFNQKLIDVERKVDVVAKELLIKDILSEIFPKDVKFIVSDRQIVLTPAQGSTELETILQQLTVIGTITDSQTGEAIPGVNVVVKGTTIGAITDATGNYSLTVPGRNVTLVFSFIGYTHQEIPLDGRATLNVSLVSEMTGLEEVVVIGYGTQKKVNVTGAISVVSKAEMEERPVATVQQALQGLAPNLSITPSNAGGEPGATMNMNIRGLTSFSGSNAPYVLVDGIPMEINDIDPSDIESVSILKDAASASIYGARAAYGVILITTKTGKDNKTGVNVSYSTNYAWARPLNVPRLVDAMTFALVANDAAINQKLTPWYNADALARLAQNIANPGSAPVMYGKPDGLTWDFAAMGLGTADNTDWYSILYKDYARRAKHNLSVSGATEKIDYYLSAGYYGEDGLLRYGDEYFDRYNFDVKINAQATSWARISTLFKYNYSVQEFPWQQEMGRGRIYDMASKLKPTMPAKYPGTDIWTQESRIAEWQAERDRTISRQVVISPRIVLEPVKGWVTNIELNYTSNDDRQTLTAKQYFWVRPNGELAPGLAKASTSYRPRTNSDEYLSPIVYSSYTRSFGKHNLTLLAGYQQELFKYFNVSADALYLLSDEIPSVNTAVGTKTVSDGVGHWSTQSAFGRLNYNYDEKYFLEANFRADGSSRFELGKRWGYFPSVSAGWVVSKEKFFPLKQQIDLFKLRASYGSLGNQNVANYLYIPTMPINQSNWLFGDQRLWTVASPNLASVNLTWEEVNTLDFGMDIGLLKDRISGSFDWYEARTTNLVGPGNAVPVLLGTGVPSENSGEVRTRGWELELKWKDKIGDLYYEIGGVLSDNLSVVTKYNNPSKVLSTYYEGMVLGELWGYETAGLFQSAEDITNWGIDQSYLWAGPWEPGDLKYVDQNGDKKINIGTNTLDDHGDRKVIGNERPRFLYGFNAGASWKGFDLSVFFQGIGKLDLYIVEIYNGNVYRGPANGPMHMMVYEEHLDYWRDNTSPLGANPNAYFAKPYSVFDGNNSKNYGRPTTQYLPSGAYLRLKNLQLGYTIPRSITRKVLISNAKIYLSIENLLTFSKLLILDPESTGGRNGDGRIYPISRLYSIGINVNF